MKGAILGAVVLALVVLVLRSGGLAPVSSEPALPDDQAAILLVRSFEPVPGRPQSIDDRISTVIENSRLAGQAQEVVGWSAKDLGDRRYLVHFALRENGVWIGAEWFVNLKNGWINPTNQYASWLMFERSF
ncbi:MAG: hypothetical protein U0556_18995 [Dehalococcoidia bacterium]